ncbi:MAG: prenyltransferase [Anaerolineaceae bacterium]
MKTILGVIRLPFLILGPACVFLGMALAIHETGAINPWYAVLAFIGGVFAHISVNALNEYDDFKSGLDQKTIPTPFSGGSGTLKQSPKKAIVALITGVVAAVIIFVIGLFFFTLNGWPIVIIGLIGLFVIAAYTPLLNRSPLLCLLAPGIGFGTLMVVGTYQALTGQISFAAVLASFIPFFLVSNLLLLNQFPDVDADKTVGRRHFPILIGRKASGIIYTAFLVATYLVIILGVALQIFPIWCLLGLVSLVFAIPAAKGALLHPDDLPKLMPSLGMNVLVNILTPLLVGIGLLISK